MGFFLLPVALAAAAAVNDAAPAVVFSRFGIVTDVHYADIPSSGSRHYRDSLPKMRDAVATFKSFNGSSGSARTLDFVVELGDLKDLAPTGAAGGVVNATIGFLDDIEGVLTSTGLPTYHVLGNHDVDILDQPTCIAHARGQPADVTRAPVLGAYSFDVGGPGSPQQQPDDVGCLATESSTSYVWLVHSDSTRNWVSKPSANCRSSALVVPDISVYLKRHGGSGLAYGLNASQCAIACTQPACPTPAPPPYAASPLHFVVLNGDFTATAEPWASIDTNSSFQWNHPWVPSAQLEWLTEDLEAAAKKGQKVIVFVHYRLDGGPGTKKSGWVSSCSLDNAQVVRNVLTASGVVLATFSGHDHAPKPPYTIEAAGGAAPDLLMFTHSAMVEGPYSTSNAYSVVSVFSNCTVSVQGFGNTTSLVHHGKSGCSVGPPPAGTIAA